jgi:hypothetical protein
MADRIEQLFIYSARVSVRSYRISLDVIQIIVDPGYEQYSYIHAYMARLLISNFRKPGNNRMVSIPLSWQNNDVLFSFVLVRTR